MSKEHITVTADDLLLTMQRNGERRERIGIMNEYPKTELAVNLFQSLGLMYLVSPYLPERISTDFYVPESFRNLIGEMYKCEEHEIPEYVLTDPKLTKQKEEKYKTSDVYDNRSALLYSGGKDTLWNLLWLSRELGMKNVLGVHFKHLNLPVASSEYKATMQQQKKIGYPLKVVDLLNSSANSGKSIMRARDMFILGLAIPLALEFAAAKIVLEGGYWDETKKGEPFTTYLSAWQYFNNLLLEMGIPVQADWRDSNGMASIKELIERRPDWLKLVHNCFSPEKWKRGRQEKWKRVAPTFPLYETQCGSCVKCRELNIARIAYDPTVQKADRSDIEAYLVDTMDWAKKHEKSLADILDGPFTEHLKNLALKYEIE